MLDHDLPKLQLLKSTAWGSDRGGSWEVEIVENTDTIESFEVFIAAFRKIDVLRISAKFRYDLKIFGV